ncbi:YkvA family protein [Pseudomonas sp. PSE14]|uniref:YkvA family protein n=1 Tax=Pseudomonas sp. PSE14 TaxID=3016341 RepID=UPI0023D809B1|nr:YkvA family protein [Pseudomonas sp. PSE14]WEJ69815.1 YkvA family protein [Pseudomonas sp. PSE14]
MYARLKQWARSIKRQTMTLWFCWKHPETPLPVKLLCLLVVSYALSPIDLIPDFIPVLGLLDDLVILPASIWLIIRLIPAPVYAQSKQQADDFERASSQRPCSTAAAVVIVAIWLLLAVLCYRWLWG